MVMWSGFTPAAARLAVTASVTWRRVPVRGLPRAVTLTATLSSGSMPSSFQASAALGKLLELALFEDYSHQASVGLLRGHVLEARMVMLGIVPGKVALEISSGLFGIQEAAGVFGRALYGAEGGFDKRIVVWGSWPCK